MPLYSTIRSLNDAPPTIVPSSRTQSGSALSRGIWT
jgi:hypothetical protein